MKTWRAQEPVPAPADYYGQIPVSGGRLLALSLGEWTPELRESKLSGKWVQFLRCKSFGISLFNNLAGSNLF
jgi:hypothetical protein